MQRTTRRSARARWLARGSVLVLLSVLAILVARPWIAGYALHRAAGMLRDRADCELSAGHVEVVLTSLTIRLQDVRLACRAAPEPPLMVADRVNLDLAMATMGRGLAFDRIELINPKVSWNAVSGNTRTGEPRAGPLPVFNVGHLEVVGLDAVVTTSSAARLLVRGLSASLDGGGPGRLSGEVRVSQGVRLEAEAVAAVVDEVSADVAIDGDSSPFDRSSLDRKPATSTSMAASQSLTLAATISNTTGARHRRTP